MVSIKRSIATGAVWMVLFKLLDRGLGLISTLILARVLTPTDFGLVAMATSLIGILELMSAFGVDVALIQRSGATKEHYNTAWTLNAFAAGIVALLLLLLSYPLSLFYGDPRLTALVCVLAIGCLVQGFENIGIVAFRKELDFQREFRFLIIKRLIAFSIAVPIALWLRSYWALALGTVFGRIAGVILSYMLHSFRPRFALTHATEFLHFSKWLLLQNLALFIRDRAGDLILGRMSGPHAVGVLSISTEIASMPGSELVAPINRAALPGYSKISHDLPALRRAYLTVAGLVSVVVIPVVAGVAVMSPIAVALLLGPKWHEAGVIIQLLAFVGIANVLLGTAHSPIVAIGRPVVFAKIFAIQAAVVIPLLLWLTPRYGVNGAAMAYVGISAGLLPLNAALVLKTLGLRLRELGAEIWRPFVSTFAMYVLTRLAMPTLHVETMSTLEAITLLIMYVPLGVVIYLSALGLLWLASGRPQSAEFVIARMVLERLDRLWLALRRS